MLISSVIWPSRWMQQSFMGKCNTVPVMEDDVPDENMENVLNKIGFNQWRLIP